jgi:6-pyruvoyltetrahydropterin/6-carboxytetrahydropterin synthase
MYTIHLAKEPFKFSCSHFTILSADHAERLHGHNYQMRVDIAVKELDPKLGLAFDFNVVKPRIRAFCDELDERILLPLNSPYLKLEKKGEQTEVQFGNKHYSFPTDDTICLQLANITSEELARYAAQSLLKTLTALPFWTAITVNVEETRGQSVSFSVQR